MSGTALAPAIGTRRAASEGWGLGYLAGETQLDEVAAPAWTLLIDNSRHRCVAGVRSGADGSFRYDQLDTASDPGRWSVLAFSLDATAAPAAVSHVAAVTG